MKKRRLWYIFLLILVLAISIFAVPAIADMGNFSGGSNYGGGSSGGGSSGGGFSGGNIFIYGGGSSGGVGGGAVVVIILFVVVAFVAMKALRVKTSGTGTGMGAAPFMGAPLAPMASFCDNDPNFSEAAIVSKISNLYVQMQEAWQDKKFDSMRPHMTDSLWNQLNGQLNEMIEADCTNYVDRIAVLGVELRGFKTDDVNDIIEAIVSTRIVDYTLNDKTGELVSGSKTTEKFMTYQWTLVRSKGMLTPETAGEGSEGTASIHCPSCGAPLEINQSAKCPYCDALISARDYDWALSAIQGLSQRNGS